jgi:hypothetical protein
MTYQNAQNVFNINTRAGFDWPELTEATDFDAVLQPIYTGREMSGDIGGVYYSPLSKTIGQAVTRSDNGDALGVVGARYGIAPNGPIYEMMKAGAESALGRHEMAGVELSEKSSYGGQFTRIELTFPGMGADIRQLTGSSTQLLFKIGLTNSFNGSGAVRLFAGAVDLWCSNGCVSGEYTRKAARHTSGFTPEIFAGFIEEQAANFKTRVRTWQAWAQNTMTPAEAEAVLNDAGMAGRKVKNVMQQFENEAAARGRTVWAFYSALTNYASHNSERFGVRNSGNVDNVAVTLDGREREVQRIVDGDAFQRVAA